MSISSKVSLLANLGMWPLPLLMMLRRSSVEAAAVLSEMSDGPPKWRPSAVLPWHFAHFVWKTGFVIRVVSADGV